MDQKQLDDLESNDQEEIDQDFLDEEQDSPEDSSEESTINEEKMNDVDEIINEKGTADKVANQNDNNPKSPEKKEDRWDWDDEEDSEAKPGRTWKIISGILLILLIAAIYTNGFNFTGAATASSLTLIDAEEKVVDYVNNNLLQPPFTAQAVSSEELDGLFKVTLDVAGQEIDSYLTKDGKFFFPQGFDLGSPPDLESPQAEEAGLVEVSIDDDPVKGDLNAPVTIVEFSEFQCPFCKKYVDETYSQIIKEYVDAGKVRYVFRDFPLDFHPNAKPAALAAECAHEQGKFWEYHDLLFRNQPDLSPENFKRWAADLSLNTEQFNQCLDSEKYNQEVENDLADGQAYGVSGTPAFFINGQLLSGAQPYSVFKQAIEEAFKAAETPAEETELEEQIEEVAEVIEEELPAETEKPEESTPKTKEFQITAKKWRFDPKHLEVNQGDQVTLTLTSELDLNFVLPVYDLEAEILAGETKTLEFTADKKGTFEFNCGTYCYKKYGELQGASLNGELVVK